MENLRIPSLEKICPYSDIDEGVDEWLDQDIAEGTYYKIVKGELLPIATQKSGTYIEHKLVSPEEIQKIYMENPMIEILSVKEWYQTNKGL